MDRSLTPSEILQLSGESFYLFSNARTAVKGLYQSLLTSSKVPTRYLIHYQTKHDGKTYGGHWCAMVVLGDKYTNGRQIWYYDSYGEFPGHQVSHIPVSYRKSTRQDQNKIGKFLKKAYDLGYKIIWNNHRHQKYGRDINTCGRWCALFLASRVDPDKFDKLVKKYKLTDEKISSWTG